jgi:predicted metal-dependent HD superfamily phosphohydrolase
MKSPSNRLSEDAWHDLMRDLRVAGVDRTHVDLLACYSEPQRAYHGLQHLAECLDLLDAAAAVQDIPHRAEIELALWFHDAVYDPKGADNEARSATLAMGAMTSWELSAGSCRRVAAMILATADHETCDEPATQWLLDIDLAILGQDSARFAQYEAQIRQEYGWVPEAVYRQKRAEILRGFLTQPRLYQTDWLHDLYDAAARRNLAALVATLED